ncbi:hypothetical protein LINPERHAP1_LOCUS20059 [Linum perenne]
MDGEDRRNQQMPTTTDPPWCFGPRPDNQSELDDRTTPSEVESYCSDSSEGESRQKAVNLNYNLPRE